MKSATLVENTVRTWSLTHAGIREGMLIQWREIKRCVRRANGELLNLVISQSCNHGTDGVNLNFYQRGMFDNELLSSDVIKRIGVNIINNKTCDAIEHYSIIQLLKISNWFVPKLILFLLKMFTIAQKNHKGL